MCYIIIKNKWLQSQAISFFQRGYTQQIGCTARTATPWKRDKVQRTYCLTLPAHAHPRLRPKLKLKIKLNLKLKQDLVCYAAKVWGVRTNISVTFYYTIQSMHSLWLYKGLRTKLCEAGHGRALCKPLKRAEVFKHCRGYGRTPLSRTRTNYFFTRKKDKP